MADVIGRFVETALRGREQGVQMFERVQRLQALKEQREQLAQDRARAQAAQQFNYVNSILTDPLKRKDLAPEQETELAARGQAYASELGLPWVDNNPIKSKVMEDITRLQRDPDYQHVPVKDRLSELSGKWGKHFWDYYWTMDDTEDLMNHQAEQAAPQPAATERPPLPGQAREFTAREGGETAPESIQVHEGAQVPQEAAEPAAPRTQEDIAGERLFGKYYTPKPGSAEVTQLLNTATANQVADEIAGGKLPEVVAGNRKQLISRWIAHNPTLSAYDITAMLDANIRVAREANVDGLLKKISADQMTERWLSDKSSNVEDRTRAASMMNQVGYLGKSDWTANDLLVWNQGGSEQTFNSVKDRALKYKITQREMDMTEDKWETEKAWGWADLSLKDRKVRIDEAQGNEQLAISRYNADTSRKEQEMAEAKFELAMNMPVESISNKDYWTARSKLVADGADSSVVAVLDEQRFVAPGDKQQLLAILKEKKAQKVPGSQAAPAVREALRSAGITDPATIKVLTNRYMAEAYWGNQ